MATTKLRDDVHPLDVFDGVHYPSSDGKPMAESGVHVQALVEIWVAIDQLYRGQDVAYEMDMFLYYEEGNPKARKTPDVMVIPDAPRNPMRRSFRIWAEGAVPAVIFEVTSNKTRKTDWTVKKRLYKRLGVKEYFLFDPLHDYQRRQLVGFRLVGRRYLVIKPETDGSLVSQVLRVRMYPEGHLLRFRRLDTNERLLFRQEETERLFEASQRADQAERHFVEEKQRADQQEQRAEQQEQRAEQEKQRAEAAEQELARLRSQLRQRGRGNGRN